MSHRTDGLHHDGSAVFVSNPYPKLGEKVTLTLRAPLDAPIKEVFVRSLPDGEGHLSAMKLARKDAVSAYWQGELTITMPRMNYRFALRTYQDGTYVYNAAGVHRAEQPDFYDFKLLADYQAPLWVHDRVFYQIFPDRFHNGDPALTEKIGAWEDDGYRPKIRNWDELPRRWEEGGAVDFFGGDLPGITAKLDYLQALGVNALYLTPIFDSRSNHRYNITDFFNVDPVLGGNQALVQLREALDARGMALILDVTPNHLGSQHPWFTSALNDPTSETAEYFTLDDSAMGYVAWLGVKTLPKLNYRSEKLRDVMYRGENSVLRTWLKAPYRIDGWRLDVANMTARQGEIQLGDEVWRGVRESLKAYKPDTYIMGENYFDGSHQLQGDQLDATMNYSGFNIPMWRWLSGYLGTWQFTDKYDDPLPSEVLAEQMTLFRAAIPWVIATQQFNQLCSHDSVRILNIVKGDKARMKLGLSLLMTYPGVPCVYYGDEIGLEGAGDPDNRRPMIWDDSRWDTDLLTHYRTMIALRKTQPALINGGYQQLIAHGDVFAFTRHTPAQRLVIVAHRSDTASAPYTLSVAQGGFADGVALVDMLTQQTFTVQNGAIDLGAMPANAFYLLEAR